MKTGFNANCFVPTLDVFSWSKKTRGKVDHSDLIRTNNLYHNIKSNNFAIRGDRDGEVFFFERGQGESTPKKSCRTKNSSEQSVLLAPKIYKKCEIKILTAILQSSFIGFKISEHIQTSQQAKTKPTKPQQSDLCALYATIFGCMRVCTKLRVVH